MTTDSRLKILNPSTQVDFDTWIGVWQSWPNREVFAHPCYVQLFSEGIGQARCAVFRSELGNVMYPFILRTIAGFEDDETNSTDIITPYGYGGCFAWDCADRARLGAAFYREFDGWANAAGVVSEFVRMSLFPEDTLPFPQLVNSRALNLVRSLDHSEHEIWRDYEAKVRKNVQKAQRSGVTIVIDERGDSIEDFYRIYLSTMERRDAAASYRYPIEFFQGLHRALDGQVACFNAVHDDSVVSTELVLISVNTVYSFLGGTEPSSFDVRPNDLLKHEITLWARSKGKQHYVLGGGYEADDGIFRYKKAFAPTGIVPFCTGERVLIQTDYDSLVRARRNQLESQGKPWDLATNYFPAYRQGVVD